MLNIFADALLIAARLGQLPADRKARDHSRRSPREFQDVEGLHVAERLRGLGR